MATFRNDNGRSGVNSLETQLTPANVNVVSFGRRAAIPVEGDIYAQPLYISNIAINGTPHNLIVVATEHDQVYAIDAQTYEILWQRNFLDSQGLVTPIPAEDVNCDAVAPEIGITGTPVIDASRETVSMIVATKETQGGQPSYYQRLHALSLVNGQDRVSAVAVNSPSDPSRFGSAQFDSLLNLQRSALLLDNGQIYVAWASHCDGGTYTGWLMSFDAGNLQQTAAWTPDPSGILGGIWMSGAGPASDRQGDVYMVIGNGWTDAMSGGSNYGDSVVRLHPSGQALSVSDYFIPHDYQTMYEEDLDLGSGGQVLLPNQAGAAHPNLLAVLSKGGTLYLLDCDHLGKSHPDNDSQIVQSFVIDGGSGFSTPLFWQNTLYLSLPHASVAALPFDPTTQQFDPTPASSSGGIQVGYPGASPSLSTNGNSDAILWVLDTSLFGSGGDAVLRAFDPLNLTTEFYDSEMSPDRDHAGAAVRFVVPTVAEGQVFVGDHNELDVYGLLPK